MWLVVCELSSTLSCNVGDAPFSIQRVRIKHPVNRVSESTSETSFFLRHEFLIRRLHSLLGIVPLGLYMVVHLATNASFINGTEAFQSFVYLIHKPGSLLPLIEWALIFAPLVFHAGIGIWISKTGSVNSTQYSTVSNKRYVLQRLTGIIALIFLFFHILHLHGWFHAEFWVDAIGSVGLAQFRPYNAGSTLAHAMNNWIWPLFYLIGVLSCVYHLANGLWTSGITWGLWVSQAAQDRASKICAGFGIILSLVAVTAWWAAVSPNADDVEAMKAVEDRMHNAAIEAGAIPDMPEKRWTRESDDQKSDANENTKVKAEKKPVATVTEADLELVGPIETPAGDSTSDNTGEDDAADQ